MKNLESEIRKIKKRNQQKDLEKAWETSFFRKAVIAVLIYGLIVIFFYLTESPAPLKNALLATICFLLSTLSLKLFKKFWVKYFYKGK